MGVLLSCSHVSIIIWLHHLDFNEALGEKATWELHMDALWRFE